MVMVIGWVAVSFIGAWWHGLQQGWTYGMPRTYQTDQFVNLGDSQQYPDHFIAENLNGLIVVVQINPENAKENATFYLTRVADSTTPVTLAFRDINKDGKLDMLVTIGDTDKTTILLINNGKQFVSQS